MVPEYKATLDKLMTIMAACDQLKIPYSTLESAASALYELETGVDKWDIGKTDEQKAKDAD